MLEKLIIKKNNLKAECELKKQGLTSEEKAEIEAQVEEYRQELISVKKYEKEEDIVKLEAQIKVLDDLIKEEEQEVILKAEYDKYKASGGLSSFEDWKIINH